MAKILQFTPEPKEQFIRASFILSLPITFYATRKENVNFTTLGDFLDDGGTTFTDFLRSSIDGELCDLQFGLRFPHIPVDVAVADSWEEL